MILVMGVSGAGKSTLAKALAEILGWPMIEGDELHLSSSIDKMRTGVSLDDGDRLPWLDRIIAATRSAIISSGNAIVVCSALKRAYRERLVSALGPPMLTVYLEVTPELARRRLTDRLDHYMPVSLLGSQFVTLEVPGVDEHAVQLAAHLSLAEKIATVKRVL